jgi:hypothetical protein
MAAIAVHETHKLNRSHAPLAKFVIDLFSSSLWCAATRQKSRPSPAALNSYVRDNCFPLG